MEPEYHTPVLVEEVLRYLPTVPDGIYVDGTLGGGGHAEAILMRLSPGGRLIGFDQDREAIASARLRLGQFGDQVTYLHENVSHIETALHTIGVDRISGALLDLGISSHQIDEKQRGFSFQTESRLDMRMNREQLLDAWKVVNNYTEQHLAEILWNYGEEKHSRRIAREINIVRSQRAINTTQDLVEVIRSVVGEKFLQKSLARVFQAIRIEVNNELGNLAQALDQILNILYPGGRLVVISYHSLEDRIVKNRFREESKTSIPSGNKFSADQPKHPKVAILTKKPVGPQLDECKNNPRARSAKLRVAERVYP
ncbi:MAG: 16S rRNA (cytosine(1402)-N(4))-methyltransferase RsmH [Ignavibacteria bacterium]|nr:16S rRNA (cytosine(1402)-N(4))-methyltransferase RsmH [Ignavibacteria bacterium]MBI3766702.1 16S rRNA (cytosine(1402)-N(4))-methyltransferase RsmH [Ignavibacteriales bacterium]